MGAAKRFNMSGTPKSTQDLPASFFCSNVVDNDADFRRERQTTKIYDISEDIVVIF